MNLLLVKAAEVSGDTLCIEGRRAVHLRKVLNVKVGDSIRIGMVRKGQGVAKVLAIVHNQVTLGDIEVTEEGRAPSTRLIIALPRPKALRKLLQTAAAFGVQHIDVVNAWRVHKSYWNSPLVTLDAMEEELWLGCEQGRHPWLPTIAVHRFLVPYIESLPEGERTRLIAHPGARRWMCDIEASLTRAVFAIGPEGGWVSSELQSFESAGFEKISISSAILRSEIALATTLAQWELLQRS